MKRYASLILALATVTFGSPAFAQKATVIDLNAKPRPFSADDYKQLVSCTVSRHPDETRRYATYFLQRRDVQTPDQNEKDPDSDLFIPALEGCFELKMGEPLPFRPAALTADWAKAHGIAGAKFAGGEDPASSPKAFAKCIWAKRPDAAAKIADATAFNVVLEGLQAGIVACGGGNSGSMNVDLGDMQALMRSTRPSAPATGGSAQ